MQNKLMNELYSLTSTLFDVGGQRNGPAPLPQQREPVPILQEAGCALGPV
jgi:hypothetical protein